MGGILFVLWSLLSMDYCFSSEQIQSSVAEHDQAQAVQHDDARWLSGGCDRFSVTDYKTEV